MLTTWERRALDRYIAAYKSKIVENIRSKQISRLTPYKGAFSSPVNASGRLAKSVRSYDIDNGIVVAALSYVEKLVYGERPGTRPPTKVISGWLRSKRINANPYAVANSYKKHGSSIWQKHRGADSGLLDVDMSAEYQHLIQEVAQYMVTRVINDIRIAA